MCGLNVDVFVFSYCFSDDLCSCSCVARDLDDDFCTNSKL